VHTSIKHITFITHIATYIETECNIDILKPHRWHPNTNWHLT